MRYMLYDTKTLRKPKQINRELPSTPKKLLIELLMGCLIGIVLGLAIFITINS